MVPWAVLDGLDGNGLQHFETIGPMLLSLSLVSQLENSFKVWFWLILTSKIQLISPLGVLQAFCTEYLCQAQNACRTKLVLIWDSLIQKQQQQQNPHDTVL